MFNFLNGIFFFIPNFMNLQRQSFLFFLQTGLIDEFQNRNPITHKKKKIKLLFYPKFYQLTFPNLNCKQAINLSKTYCSKLYLPVQ